MDAHAHGDGGVPGPSPPPASFRTMAGPVRADHTLVGSQRGVRDRDASAAQSGGASGRLRSKEVTVPAARKRCPQLANGMARAQRYSSGTYPGRRRVSDPMLSPVAVQAAQPWHRVARHGEAFGSPARATATASRGSPVSAALVTVKTTKTSLVRGWPRHGASGDGFNAIVSAAQPVSRSARKVPQSPEKVAVTMSTTTMTFEGYPDQVAQILHQQQQFHLASAATQTPSMPSTPVAGDGRRGSRSSKTVLSAHIRPRRSRRRPRPCAPCR
jgi:hypothetical protein